MRHCAAPHSAMGSVRPFSDASGSPHALELLHRTVLASARGYASPAGNSSPSVKSSTRASTASAIFSRLSSPAANGRASQMPRRRARRSAPGPCKGRPAACGRDTDAYAPQRCWCYSSPQYPLADSDQSSSSPSLFGPFNCDIALEICA